LNTARAPRAISSMIGREAGEAISSSEVKRAMSGRRARFVRAKASSTKVHMTSPAFMSATPGPKALPPSTLNGRKAAVPLGKTVSR
jgi:hypothetical protein